MEYEAAYLLDVTLPENDSTHTEESIIQTLRKQSNEARRAVDSVCCFAIISHREKLFFNSRLLLSKFAKSFDFRRS